jgi:hypothetical protein
MNLTLYLAENSITFRWKSNELYTQKNVKYLGLSQFEGELADYYCGKKVLNELTELMAEKVHSEMISCTQSAKYFFIIACCIPEISCGTTVCKNKIC